MVKERIDPWFSFRIKTIFVFVLFCMAGLGVRLYYIQIENKQFYQKKAEHQQIVRVEIGAKRGTINDVNGMGIASTEKSVTVCLIPHELNDNVDCVSMIADLLRMDPDVIRRKIASGKKCVYLKRKIPESLARRIRELNIPGIDFEFESKRTYPNERLFCHVAGFAGIDNEGLEGLEYYYDVLLTGKRGFQEINRNALSSTGSFIRSKGSYIPQKDGADIYLTLDGYIQGITAEVIRGLYSTYSPEWVSAVVMDPRNGRILAMANMPDFLPSRFYAYPADVRRNRTVTDMYEPGSVMKIFTASAAIEEGLDPEETLFDCEEGYFVYKGRELHDHDLYGKMNLRDIIVHSSNIGMAKIGIYLGKKKLHSHLYRFGFSRRTGIGFPGEQSGYLRPVQTWDSFTLTSVPMGHEITCTSLQVAAAASAIVNGGILYRPRLVDRIADSRGRLIRKFRPEKVRRVISEKTSITMKDIMKDVVDRGTGRKAQIPGIEVGGKTGTAQLLVADPVTGEKRYSDEAYMASFCGFAPVCSPKICIIISVKHPKGDVYYGGSVAAPAVSRIIHKTLDYISEPVMTYTAVKQ